MPTRRPEQPSGDPPTRPPGGCGHRADRGGLYLEVRPTGSRPWRYRYRIGSTENVCAKLLAKRAALSTGRCNSGAGSQGGCAGTMDACP
ncbi:Arm DNA-binding domain-containing protein [Xanthomonas euroxanthea]|uniref:Arm DNA-binding domain-containing protein n=1 Tax=Xanthomonas euroxanthea TaxID=2259622 RepID=UPI003CCDDE8C